MRRLRPIALVLSLALLVPVVTGCGKGSLRHNQPAAATPAEVAVRATLTRLVTAVASRDYTLVCNQLLASNLTAQIAAVGLACPAALAKGFGNVQSPALTVRSLHVNGTQATAVVHATAANQPSGDVTLGLTENAGHWQISSLTSNLPQLQG